MSCYYVRQGSYVDGSIAGETCALVQAEAAKTCCELNPGFSQCLLCGDGGVAFPDATFTRLEGEDPVSCSFIGTYGEQGYLNATECEYFKSLAGPCCTQADTPTTGPPVDSAGEPTASPGDASEVAEPTAAPNSSASSGRLRLFAAEAAGMLLTGSSFALAWN
jgi:hypothetical protein